jgi:hypothetical protein
MKIFKFKYTDSKNKVSERFVVPMHEATTDLIGFDLTEFDPLGRVDMMNRIHEAQELYRKALKDLKLNSQIRRFKESGMEDKETTDI